jgi:hypothetical protein
VDSSPGIQRAVVAALTALVEYEIPRHFVAATEAILLQQTIYSMRDYERRRTA